MEKNTINANATANRQVIEINGEAVGVVVPDAGTLKFVAVKYHVWELDAQRFATADAARHAVVAHLAGARARPGRLAEMAA
ncbi:hypothetical protein C8J35_10320 [Rhizobium sp. PP-F2F-G38]|uniref:Uncharacterized protein n=1 Tax=Ferranicluibacter rubi TaxID=2715133 RepID=A0AA44C914_9HYPH|nr:hypothetical protein [Ferranicluibacter rubi]PYE31277.1 hypothetical protein C8J37_11277 [Rhizobium sp. PP-WC-1G-195]PYE98427.1 hypothetical protein C8J35_10320 [Rhizobium sp. PP-F2F-G38]TCP89252.1 hypothetical protein C8J31_102425 [Rhizobium sp. PP-CC-2G-626]TCQ11880.1 hypothetical protein C8J34_101515 [Rhizobium sp. PP-F2F-G36]NHT74389.1 hypothetical protein [Ferranicluibacter rubi]